MGRQVAALLCLGSLLFFLVPVLFGQGQYVAVDAGELRLGGPEFFGCDFALVQATAKVFCFLLQPGEFPVNAAQGSVCGGVGIVCHNITSKI